MHMFFRILRNLIFFLRISSETQAPIKSLIPHSTNRPTLETNIVPYQGLPSPVTPSTTTSPRPPPTNPYKIKYSSTQDAIDDVGSNIQRVKNSLFPELSERHKAVIRLGNELTEIKAEVSYLRECLKNSQEEKDLLKRRLSYFEQREEDDLIRQSIEYGCQKDQEDRNRKYAVYAPSNFNRKF